MSLYRMVPYNYDSAPIGVPATMQLVEVEPTERVCIPHETTANMTDDTCWWSKQLTDPMPCIWQDSVWLTKEDEG